MRGVALLVASALALAGCRGSTASSSPAPAPATALPEPQLVGDFYRNPVLDSDFPDPAVIRAKNGVYYAYATQAEQGGRWTNVQAARSTDLVTWEPLGDALPVKPTWAAATQDFWAPHVAEHDGRYYLYYSAKPDAALTDSSRGLCLAVATADRPEGPFTDSGQPLQCGAGFGNIDPFSYDDPATGRRLLYWGSDSSPIMVQELGPNRMSFAPGSQPVELIPALRGADSTDYQRLVEGAWVVLRGGWYYLFYSGNNCCGPHAHYALMVARSQSATGPFETLAQATGASNSVILEKRDIWVAPGHNAVVKDEAGEDWMLYHAVDSRRPRSSPSAQINTRRVMLLDRIVWKDGWPRIDGIGPSSTPQARPAKR